MPSPHTALATLTPSSGGAVWPADFYTADGSASGEATLSVATVGLEDLYQVLVHAVAE